MDKVDRHLKHCLDLNELYKKKNADYGDSFHKTYLEEGLAMCRIRLSDKLERFKTLSKSQKAMVADETIIDTLIDLANYAILTVLELEDTPEANGLLSPDPLPKDYVEGCRATKNE